LSTERCIVPEPDTFFMAMALQEADLAAQHGDVPIGCVIVDDLTGNVIGRGHNRREIDKDPTAHAELVALREASRVREAWHLSDTTLFVTVEPCPMCAGAIVNARVKRVVYGCDDPKAGAIRSLYAIASDPRLNHQADVTAGVESDLCAQRLRDFFAALRQRRQSRA
jgi:tRNA(adenine34) deaminase